MTKMTKKQQKDIIDHIYSLCAINHDISMRVIACEIINFYNLKCNEKYFYGHADNLYDYLETHPDSEYGIVFDSDYITFNFPIMEECKTIWC